MFKLHELLKKECISLAESELNLLLLNKDSLYPWFILVPKRENITEIFQLSSSEQTQLANESSFLSKTLFNNLKADKMNVAALGNMCPQLHLHHIVRYKDDSAWPKPIWGVHKSVEYSDEEINQLLLKIKSDLSDIFTFKD